MLNLTHGLGIPRDDIDFSTVITTGKEDITGDECDELYDVCTYKQACAYAKKKGGDVVTLGGEQFCYEYGVVHGDQYKHTWFLNDNPKVREDLIGDYDSPDEGESCPIYQYTKYYFRVPRKYFPILGEAKNVEGVVGSEAAVEKKKEATFSFEDF